MTVYDRLWSSKFQEESIVVRKPVFLVSPTRYLFSRPGFSATPEEPERV